MAGRARVATLFGTDAHAERVQTIYDRLLQSSTDVGDAADRAAC
jgi:hypothetical protein